MLIVTFDDNRISRTFLSATVLLAIALVALVVLPQTVHSDKRIDQQFEAAAPAKEGKQVAIFAGGCFWCMEGPFDKLDGVSESVSGYIGGRKKNPSYEEVSSGKTGHTEAVQISYDPRKITYSELLDVFWRNIDPTTADRQFCDKGSQYRPGIFYLSPEQKTAAEKSRSVIEKTKSFPESIVVEITKAGPFYRAEEYHQDFYRKKPSRYKSYRVGCGRDRRLEELWGKSTP